MTTSRCGKSSVEGRLQKRERNTVSSLSVVWENFLALRAKTYSQLNGSKFSYAVQGGFNCLSLWMISSSVTIQMKATEQYFRMVLFIMLYEVVLTFEFVDEIFSVTIQIKATEQYFPVVPLIMLYKEVKTFEYVDEI